MVVATVPMGDDPRGVAVTPDGKETCHLADPGDAGRPWLEDAQRVGTPFPPRDLGLSLLLDLQKQRDQFALAMRVRLGKDGFQLISRRLPGNMQFAGGDIGRSSTRDDAGDLCFRRCQPECLGEDRRGRSWPWSQGIERQKCTHFLPRLMRWPVEGPNAHDDR